MYNTKSTQQISAVIGPIPFEDDGRCGRVGRADTLMVIRRRPT